MTALTEGRVAKVRALALGTYRKVRIGRPGMPHEDTPEGQRKLERLFDILAHHAAQAGQPGEAG